MTSNWSQQCPLSSHCSLSPTHQSLRYVGDNLRNSREKTVRRRMVIVTRILGTSFMDYPGRQRTRKEVFWFCHQCSSLQSYVVLGYYPTLKMADVECRCYSCLDKNTMKGSFVLSSSLLSLLYNFLCTMLSKTSGKDRHMRMIEKWATKDLRTPKC